MSTFYQKARRLRHHIPRHTNESKAKIVASRAFEKGTSEWEAAYEAKLRQFNLDDQIALVADAKHSNSLNRKININDYDFGG